MLSIICVATITGFPAWRQARTRRFWIGGTFCTGSSTPRSPRATMIPSEASRIDPNDFTAAGFSILDSTAARPLANARASFTSSARCTNESASQSTPSVQANSRSRRSFSVSAASGRTTSGTLIPFRSEISPPTATLQFAKSGPQSCTVSLIFPSLTNSASPLAKTEKISGCGTQTRRASPGVLSRSRRKSAPSFSATGPSANVPQRSFGP